MAMATRTSTGCTGTDTHITQSVSDCSVGSRTWNFYCLVCPAEIFVLYLNSIQHRHSQYFKD